MRHIRHLPHKKCNIIIPTRRLTNVWYGLFKGSETLEIYIYSSLTVWRQSICRQRYDVCEIKHGRIYVFLLVCLCVCLFVCLSVSLSVYQKGILPLASDLLRHCLGLKHNFFRDVPKSKQYKLVNTKKIYGGDFGPPWLLRW